MNAAGTAFLVIFILLVAGVAGWVGFTQFRARRLGLPPPSWRSYVPFLGSREQSPYGPPQPRRGGPVGWIEDRVAEFRQKRDRTATGAYEQGRALDPDDAWDSRVPGDQGYRHGGYYNETELEQGRGRAGQQPLAPGHAHGGAADAGTHSGSGYQMNIPRPNDEDEDPPRGRPRSRGGDSTSNPFGEGAVRQNPFAEVAEPSNMSADLRKVSPRPMADGETAAAKAQGQGRDGESPNRRSMFREDV